MASDQAGLTGRTLEQGGHYHDGSWYTDDECPCSLAPDEPYTEPDAGFGGQDITYERW